MSKYSDLVGYGTTVEVAKIMGRLGSVAAAVTAAGTVITDATDLVDNVVNITTAAASTGVQLPDFPLGDFVLIKNGGASTVNIFPPSSTGTINGGSAGAAVTLASTKHALLIRISNTDWMQIAID